MFHEWFLVAVVATFMAVLYSRSAPVGKSVLMSAEYIRFERVYLVGYFFMMAGDWLQGPYVYALYDSYGISREDIAMLFVAGFGSSMVFGTFIGSLADRHGRKRFALLYVLFYVASCLTKHFNNFSVLMIGRILGGIATSLLFSVFETWFVCESNNRGYEKDWLSETFSKAAFGNSIVAVVCGVLAEAASDNWASFMVDAKFTVGGYTAPFDLASAMLVLGGVFISKSWNENYGDSSTKVFASRNFFDALEIIRTNRVVLLCGMVQSLFEGAMYSFVFMWSPVLMHQAKSNDEVPFGTVFSTFMLCCMLGSQVFGLLLKRFRVETILLGVAATAAVGLATVPLDIWLGTRLSYPGFLLFEVCAGIYFPAMGTLKSKIVPDEQRSTIYNIFRVPLNAIVLFVLLGNFEFMTTFQLCCILLLVAVGCQHKLMVKLRNKAEMVKATDTELNV